MTAINWHEKPEPWRSIGLQWVAWLAAGLTGDQPSPPKHTSEFSPGEIRTLRGSLTMRAFAARLGVSQITVSRWENGRKPKADGKRRLREYRDSLSGRVS
jgi:Helix-turn-helix